MLQARSPFRTLAKNRTISPPPPSRQGRLFPPCRGNPVISLRALRGRLLHRPVELGSVDPHAVQNDRELPRDSDLGLAEAVFGRPRGSERTFKARIAVPAPQSARDLIGDSWCPPTNPYRPAPDSSEPSVKSYTFALARRTR
jgi:hypothetical protein